MPLRQPLTVPRVAVLSKLQKVTEEFVREVAKKKNLAQSIIDNGGGKIFTFGSYRLGVYGPGE
jgi:poly(A) polymerase